MAAADDTHDPAGGWQQGSLLPASAAPPSIYWAHAAEQASRPAKSAVKVARQQASGDLDGYVPAERSVRAGERAVVISHSCDLVKSAASMPQVELARVFETDNPAVMAEAENLGSSRYFRLDDGSVSRALVLDYTWRTFADKGLLDVYEPENDHLASPERRKALARWLGRRYARPVLEDEDVASVADPVRLRWQALVAEEPETAAKYSAEFSEFRFRRDQAGVTLFVLSPKREPDVVMALEVAGLLAAALEPRHSAVHVSEVRSYHAFTKADELSTAQIDLEWASHDEGVAVGELAVD